MYDKLKEILDKCIENGWKPWGDDKYKTWTEIRIFWICFVTDPKAKTWVIKHAHDLFSKESWLMEFVKWKEEGQEWEGFFAIGKIITYAEHNTEYDELANAWEPIYAYMIMWPMTEEEKIAYFIENIILD